jgi:hypothetical protein
MRPVRADALVKRVLKKFCFIGYELMKQKESKAAL